MKMKKKRDKTILILTGILIILAITLVLIYIQNVRLKKEISNLNIEYERGVSEGVNDFTLQIIEKLKTCEQVLLTAEGQSATIKEVSCR